MINKIPKAPAPAGFPRKPPPCYDEKIKFKVKRSINRNACVCFFFFVLEISAKIYLVDCDIQQINNNNIFSTSFLAFNKSRCFSSNFF